MRTLNRQLNVRLPQATHEQIDRLCRDLGYTKAQLIIVMADRMTRDRYGDTPAVPDQGQQRPTA